MSTYTFTPVIAKRPRGFQARYIGSLPEYRGRVGTATWEGDSYTLVLNTGLPFQTPATLRGVRRTSLELVTVVLD